MKKILSGLFFFILYASAAPVHAKVQTKTVTYDYAGVTMKGYLAWDDAIHGKRPGVLVVHEFWGLNDYARRRAEQLAGLGYVAFAADMYGEGKVSTHPEEAMAMMKTVNQNIALWRGRADAALAVLKGQPQVDGTKLAAIGYCFGGATVLQMIYGGAPLKAVVSFHGALPVPESTQQIPKDTRILILHGADDAFIGADTIQKIKTAFDQGKVNYKFIAYPGAVHSFTVKEAGNDVSKGTAYNAAADQASWSELTRLLQDVFK